jgi:predicted DNA binding CopG/RHH family protein
MKKLKKIPKFENESQEREFWTTNDVTEYFDLSKAVKMKFPNLKKSTKSISIRLPVDMIEELKIKANSMDVPYQSLIKIILKDGLSA